MSLRLDGVRQGWALDDRHLPRQLARTREPLIWKTVGKPKVKSRRGKWELSVINRLHEILAKGVDIMVPADRGFGDQRLFAYLDTIGWSYAIRSSRTPR